MKYIKPKILNNIIIEEQAINALSNNRPNPPDRPPEPPDHPDRPDWPWHHDIWDDKW